MKMLWVIIVIVGVSWIISKANPYDDTDDRINKKRSGLIVYTDHKTGCQWISAPTFFGLGRTPLVPRPRSCEEHNKP